MSFNIILSLDAVFDIDITPSIVDDDCYDVKITIPPDTKIEDFLKQDNLKRIMRDEISKYSEYDEELFKYSLEAMNTLLNSEFDVLNNCNSVTINQGENVISYLENNPILLEKVLCLDNVFKISHDDLEPVIREFAEYKDKIYVLVDGNSKPVKISEYEKTVLAIDDIVAKINKYNLSPIEQIMYAYDLVRDRVYQLEDDGEDYSVSRDISSVLFGDKIVCVGFAEIFSKVLDALNIRNVLFTIVGRKSGHMRNAVYVNDSKYDIHGVFFFDPTWDSQREKGSINYLNSYKYFCRTKDEIDSLSPNYRDQTFSGYKEELIWEFEDIVDEKGIHEVPASMVRIINEICKFIDGDDKELISPFIIRKDDIIPDYMKDNYDFEKIMSGLERYRRLFYDAYLKPEVFLEALYNVRKIEYYEEPNKYPFDVESFRKIMVESRGVSREDYLLAVIFGDKMSDDYMNNDSFYDYVDSNEIDKKIEQVKLANALRGALDAKRRK